MLNTKSILGTILPSQVNATLHRNLTDNPMWNPATQQKLSEKLRAKDLPRALLEKLYLDKQLSTREIAKLTGHSPNTILRHLRQYHNIPIRVNAHHMVKPNLSFGEDLAYILGVLKGDGYISYYKPKSDYRVVLNVVDEDFAIAFFNTLKRIGLHPALSQRTSKSNFKGRQWTSEQYVVRAYSKIFVEWHETLQFRHLFQILATSKYRCAFIRGIYDSEGCLNKKKGKNSYSLTIWNTDKKLIEFIEILLEIEGIYFYHRNRQDYLFGIEINRREIIEKFLNKVGSNIRRKQNV